jgi:hypothetical protein
MDGMNEMIGLDYSSRIMKYLTRPRPTMESNHHPKNDAFLHQPPNQDPPDDDDGEAVNPESQFKLLYSSTFHSMIRLETIVPKCHIGKHVCNHTTLLQAQPKLSTQ